MLISAPQGRSGKTIATLALCAILRKQGYAVQPFKKGPDFIDPSWLREAAGRECRNLDPYLMPEEVMLDSFHRSCAGAGFAVVEGAMGLYDGPELAGWGSTAHLARLLKLPVILVVNCARMTGSIAAMVSGYQGFQPDVNVAAVILNNVSGPRHERKLRTAVEQFCRIPVVGSVPRDKVLDMTQRHLGHVPFPEEEGANHIIEQIGSRLETCIDIEAIINLSGNVRTAGEAGSLESSFDSEKVRIGILRDRVFNFYYPENLEALIRAGAETVNIDSLRDGLPEVDGIYIGGGFPEFFLPELESNHGLRRDIARAVEAGMPVYAECAGLMYLCRAINWQGRRYEMVGIIPAEVEMSDRPQGHGYVETEVTGENPLFTEGTTLRGHEFHHSKLVESEGLKFAYSVRRGNGAGEGCDGITYKNLIASYTHLHALGTPQWAEAFVSLVREQKQRSLVLTLEQ